MFSRKLFKERNIYHIVSLLQKHLATVSEPFLHDTRFHQFMLDNVTYTYIKLNSLSTKPKVRNTIELLAHKLIFKYKNQYYMCSSLDMHKYCKTTYSMLFSRLYYVINQTFLSMFCEKIV